ncbi:hypothetical protein FRC12_001026 [Ceratobasidium sp. 428]|nr:hypothetical protein FRC12_001026 [Ceratobasidium sp. 428]
MLANPVHVPTPTRLRSFHLHKQCPTRHLQPSVDDVLTFGADISITPAPLTAASLSASGAGGIYGLVRFLELYLSALEYGEGGKQIRMSLRSVYM